MISFSTNPNVVCVSTVQKGCCQVEFDSTYPIHLNGVISQQEFRESIDNVNLTIASRKPLVIGAVIAGLSLCIGIIFFIIGGATVRIARSTQYLFLIGLGGAFFVAAMIIFVVSSCVIQSKMVTRLQQAIAQESAKYSQRSPKPCSWRLDTTRTTTGYNNNRRTYVSYHIIIDIGNAAPSMYGGGGQPSATYVSSYTAPPSYGQAAGTLCRQCGVPLPHPNAQFCSSCGHPFNKY